MAKMKVKVTIMAGCIAIDGSAKQGCDLGPGRLVIHESTTRKVVWTPNDPDTHDEQTEQLELGNVKYWVEVSAEGKLTVDKVK